MNNAIIALYSLQATLQVGLCVFLAYKCFEDRLRYSKRRTIGFAIAFIAVSVIIIELFIERTALFPGHALEVGLFWAGLAVVFVIVMIRTPLLHLFFLVFFLYTVTIKTVYVSRQIESLNIFPKGEMAYIITSMAVLCCMVPFMWYLLVVLLKKVIALKELNTHMQWLFVLPFAYFILYTLVGGSSYINLGVRGLVALLASNSVTYLSYVAVLRMLLSMHESLIATTRVDLFEQMLVVQKQQYQKMASDIARSDRIEHDFRHNIMVMKQFAQAGDLTGLLGYLQDYEQTNIPLDNTPICTHPLVDVILRHYVALAKKEGITVRAHVPFPATFQIADSELVVLFGNLLENALESCSRQQVGERFIAVETKIISESVLAVQVSNSYQGNIARQNSLFLSSKRSGTGIGVSTIRFIAEKNGGNASFAYDEGVFTARVLLMDGRPADCGGVGREEQAFLA